VGDHPVEMPPDVRSQLWEQSRRGTGKQGDHLIFPAYSNACAQWGADQEMEASVNWLIENQNPRWAHALRAARRPEPPTLAEQATTALHAIASGANDAREQCHDIATVTAALTRLAELEAQQ
jgi:uncharacterized protein (DUF2235 family)